MEIWTSFEAYFKPFPNDHSVKNHEEFMDELAEMLYDPEVFEWECSLSWSTDRYTITFEHTVNPKEIMQPLAEAIAKCGGQGEITTQYVTNIMKMPDWNDDDE